jgi:hypothetical protein
MVELAVMVQAVDLGLVILATDLLALLVEVTQAEILDLVEMVVEMLMVAQLVAPELVYLIL